MKKNKKLQHLRSKSYQTSLAVSMKKNKKLQHLRNKSYQTTLTKKNIQQTMQDMFESQPKRQQIQSEKHTAQQTTIPAIHNMDTSNNNPTVTICQIFNCPISKTEQSKLFLTKAPTHLAS